MVCEITTVHPVLNIEPFVYYSTIFIQLIHPIWCYFGSELTLFCSLAVSGLWADKICIRSFLNGPVEKLRPNQKETQDFRIIWADPKCSQPEHQHWRQHDVPSESSCGKKKRLKETVKINIFSFMTHRVITADRESAWIYPGIIHIDWQTSDLRKYNRTLPDLIRLTQPDSCPWSGLGYWEWTREDLYQTVYLLPASVTTQCIVLKEQRLRKTDMLLPKYT